MRFYCENACAKQAAKCEFEFIVFTKGTNIVGTNFALFIVGHGLEEGLGDLFPTSCTSPKESYGNGEKGEDHQKGV